MAITWQKCPFPSCFITQGSQKVPSSCLGQVGFSLWPIPFYLPLADRQKPRKITFQSRHKNRKWKQVCICPWGGQATFESSLSKGQAWIEHLFTFLFLYNLLPIVLLINSNYISCKFSLVKYVLFNQYRYKLCWVLHTIYNYYLINPGT